MYISKEKAFLFIFGIVTLIVVAIMFVPDYYRYSKATKAKEREQYDDAIRIFDQLDDYKDSEEQLIETRYLKALYLRQNDDYESAQNIFHQLGDYKDSEEQYKDIGYEVAVSLLDDRDYVEAAKAFGVEYLSGYKDSELRQKECWYKHALSLESDYEFEEATIYYIKCGNYEDCEDRIVQCDINAIDNANILDDVFVGGYDWILVDKQEGKALLLMKNSRMGYEKYNELYVKTGWHDSSIRKVVNESIDNFGYSQKERELVMPVRVIDDENYDFDVDSTDENTDLAFLFSKKEISKYFPDTQILYDSVTENDGERDIWWLRGCEVDEWKDVYHGYYNDPFSIATVKYEADIRPAIWIRTQIEKR